MDEDRREQLMGKAYRVRSDVAERIDGLISASSFPKVPRFTTRNTWAHWIDTSAISRWLTIISYSSD